jgi:hypothetical protein
MQMKDLKPTLVKAIASDSRIKRKMEELRDLWDDGASSRKKDALHPYCATVLSEYRDQRKRGAAPGESRRIVQLAKVKNGEKLRHSVRRIIAATSNADDKAASRMTLALRYGYRKKWVNIEAELKENGGISGCAKKFAALKKKRKRKRNRRKKLSRKPSRRPGVSN